MTLPQSDSRNPCRAFFLALLFTAGALSAACVDTGKQNLNATPTPAVSPTPTATPTVMVEPLTQENGERPIIINGLTTEINLDDGSIELDFNHDDGFWEEDRNGNYICYGCRITEYWMYKPQPFPPAKDFVKYVLPIKRLSIKATPKDGSPKNIEVNQVASNVELTFDSRRTYTRLPANGRKHKGEGIKIQKVVINSEAEACENDAVPPEKTNCAKFIDQQYVIRIKVERSPRTETEPPAQKK